MLEPNFSPFPELQTEKLLLRRIVKEDAEVLFYMRSSEKVMQYIDKERATKLEDVLALVQVFDDALNSNNGITWAIALKEDPNKLIGTIGFWRIIKQHYRAEIGYMLHPDFWGKKVMKESIEAVIQFGFSKMQLHSIEAHINPGNSASAGILERMGFIREAYFREDFYFRGEFRDSAIYSLLTPGS
jgi:ribosomal-protein-alanine N-acetyltransferase